MKKNERKLLILAGALFLTVVLVRVVPLVIDQYRDGEAEVTQLENRIEQYRELVRDTNRWAEREFDMRRAVERYEEWLFAGATPAVVGSNVQRALRQAADQAGLSLRETNQPRYGNTEGWLIVQQEVSFTIDQSQILPFLDQLENSQPRLFITEFEIAQSRRQYTGSLTVTGFSRLPES